LLPFVRELEKWSQNVYPIKETCVISLRVAQFTRHPLVDGLHSIDFAEDKRTGFLLTLKMKGVKTNSFFDSF
jgi:hypothetical protein